MSPEFPPLHRVQILMPFMMVRWSATWQKSWQFRDRERVNSQQLLMESWTFWKSETVWNISEFKHQLFSQMIQTSTLFESCSSCFGNMFAAKEMAIPFGSPFFLNMVVGCVYWCLELGRCLPFVSSERRPCMNAFACGPSIAWIWLEKASFLEELKTEDEEVKQVSHISPDHIILSTLVKIDFIRWGIGDLTYETRLSCQMRHNADGRNPANRLGCKTYKL